MKGKRILSVISLVLSLTALVVYLTCPMAEGSATETVSLSPFSQSDIDFINQSSIGGMAPDTMRFLQNATTQQVTEYQHTGFDLLGRSLPLTVLVCATVLALSLLSLLRPKQKALGWAACVATATLGVWVLLPTLPSGAFTPLALLCAALFLLSAVLLAMRQRKAKEATQA